MKSDQVSELHSTPQWLTQVAKVGEQIHAAWLMKERLEALLEVSPSDGVTLKEAVEFKSPLNAHF